MKNLNQSQIDSFKESWYTFEEIKHINDALWEDDSLSLTAEEVYKELFLNIKENHVSSKI
jgi:hypothetical protein